LAQRDKATAKAGTRRLEVTIESQRKKQIIEAARSCITEEGVERLTLRKVAERAQVSHATIAYYFNTRRELIDSALLEISESFMIGLRQRQFQYGTKDLADLIDNFLDAENQGARFVVQMIDAGIHDSDLRETHDEFISYGRDRIEKSLIAGMEMGELRSDVDPKLAAALLHTVLIFWQAELVAGATSRDRALQVGRLVLSLLDVSSQVANTGTKRGLSNGRRHESFDVPASPADVLEAALGSDPRISSDAAQVLTTTFRQLYELVITNGQRPAAVPRRSSDGRS
jgi:AcrR family transcriptional regulator